MFFRRRKGLLTVVALLMFLLSAQAQNSSYEELQAAYLYNFAKYIKWPNDEPTFVIGIYCNDDDDISHHLQSMLKDRKVAGKEIILKKITTVQDLPKCNIIFLPASNSGDIGAVKKAITDQSTLLVTEDDLIKKGAAISFVIEESKLRFKLKKNALEEAKLVASDGLLKLAIQL